MGIPNEQLKPIIDEILQYYFSKKTLMHYSHEGQANMVSQNKGLRNACVSVCKFSDNESELIEYIKVKIEKINKGEV